MDTIVWRPSKTRRYTRRQLLINGAKVSTVTVAVGSFGTLLAACGGGESGTGEAPASNGGDGATTTTGNGGQQATEPAAGDVAKGGTLNYGTLGDVDYGSLDMTTTTGTNDLEVGRSLNDPYIWLLSDGSFAPGLAESWEASEDGLEYTFKLREGITFHDGTPVDAEAAKWNFDRMTSRETNPSGLSYSYLGAGVSYGGAEVLDKQTFKITLTQANAIFLFRMRRKYMAPQSPTAVEEHGDEYFRNPVGAGPFKFVEWVEGDHVTMEANPDYSWGPPQIFENAGPPHLDRITYRIFKDSATKAVALEAGEIDYASNLEPEDIIRFQDMEDIEVVIRDKMGQSVFLSLNVEKAPTDDIAVRQAIATAIDRQALSDSLLFGLLEPAYHLFTKNMFSYDPSLESLFQYDQEKSQAVLEEAGWTVGSDGIREKDGSQLQLQYIVDQATLPIAQFIQAELKKIGIATEIQVLQGSGLLESTLRGDHNVLGGKTHWIQEDPDVLRNWAHSSLIDVRQNYIRARNKELDDLLDRGIQFAGDVHAPEREAIYQEAQKRIMESYYIVPLYYNRSLEAKRIKVRGDIGFDPYGTYHEWLDVSIDD